MWKIKLQIVVWKLLDKVWTFINGTVIHRIFSCPQVIKNSRQHLLPRQIFYRKQSSDASVYLSVYHLKQERWPYSASEVIKLHQNLAVMLPSIPGKENVLILPGFFMVNYCLCHQYEIAWIAKYDLLGYFLYQRLHWA